MAQIEVGAVDPVQAFVQTLKDLVEITTVFKENDSIPPLDYLRATQQTRETFGAIVFAVMSAQMVTVSDKLTPESRQAFDAEQIQRDLGKDTSNEGTMKDIARLLDKFSISLDIDTDDLPPGFPGITPGGD